MPELPEVETVIRTLQYQLEGESIDDVEVRYERVIEGNVEEFKKKIKGASFDSFERRGKYLRFCLNDNLVLYVHLRMEGKFYIFNTYEETLQKHIHIVFRLKSGRYLCYHDTRKFGRFYLVKQGQSLKEIDKLGYEPFDDALTSEIIYQMCQDSKEDLKSFLLNQEHICGIGNIYANEICYFMGVHPKYKVNKLSQKECSLLLKGIRDVLSKAIEAGGTTIRSYTSSLGVTGLFQLQVKVHGREHLPCVKCGTPIVKMMLHQRGTYYCPGCQKRGSRS